MNKVKQSVEQLLQCYKLVFLYNAIFIAIVNSFETTQMFDKDKQSIQIPVNYNQKYQLNKSAINKSAFKQQIKKLKTAILYEN